MSAKIKALLDKSVELHGKLQGKVGAAFTSSGGTATGAETTILSILQGLLIHGMIVQGSPHAQHYGLAVVGAPKEKDKDMCIEFGARISKLTIKIAEQRIAKNIHTIFVLSKFHRFFTETTIFLFFWIIANPSFA